MVIFSPLISEGNDRGFDFSLSGTRDQGPGTSSWCWFFIVVGCFISVTGILQQCGPEESKNANSH